MPVSTGTSITASSYNAIRSTLSSIYATQYGQALRSASVISSVNSVTSQQLLNLFLDAQSTFVHQTGNVSIGLAVPPTGQTIGANQSQIFNQSTGAKTTPVDGTIQGVNDFESLVTTVSNFDPSVSGFPATSFSPGSPLNSSRSTQWGGVGQVESIYHVVTVAFDSVNAMNFYFNAGGEIRFTASLTGGSGSKDTDWQGLLSAMGTVTFNKFRITASSGTPTPAGSGGSGYDSLTPTYRQLFIKTGSGVYADNDYTISGFVSGSTLRFRIEFNDGDVGTNAGNPEGGTPIDEPVTGTTTSTVNTGRPNSSFVYNSTTYSAVSLPAPTLATVIALTTDNVTPPA
jgi:hypothetical protein